MSYLCVLVLMVITSSSVSSVIVIVSDLVVWIDGVSLVFKISYTKSKNKDIILSFVKTNQIQFNSPTCDF
jgi:hypothetical protein